MTEQTQRPTRRTGAAAPDTARPRPLGEVRSWPRTFADRLTTPLPGVRGMTRLARERAMRPNAEGLRGIHRLPFAPAPLPVTDRGTSAVTWAAIGGSRVFAH